MLRHVSALIVGHLQGTRRISSVCSCCSTLCGRNCTFLRFTQLTLEGFFVYFPSDFPSVSIFRFAHVKFRLQSSISITTEIDRQIGYKSINKTYFKSLDTFILIIYHERRVSAS